MKSLIAKAIIKLGAKSLLFTAAIGSAIGLVGYLNHWQTSLAYSNAFFLAGCFVLIAGTATQFAAQADYAQTFRFERFREMSFKEQADLVADSTGPFSRVALGVSSGVSLALIAILIDKLF